MLYVCALCYNFICYNHVLSFRSLHLVRRHYQVHTPLPFSSFLIFLHLLCYPFLSPLFFLSFSSSLSTMIGLLGFVLFLVPSSLSDSYSGEMWLMLFFIHYLFPSNFSNCSMMALNFAPSVFRDDCCWSILGRLTLTWLWVLVLWLDWLSRHLGRYLAMLVVFLSNLRWFVRKFV